MTSHLQQQQSQAHWWNDLKNKDVREYTNTDERQMKNMKWITTEQKKNVQNIDDFDAEEGREGQERNLKWLNDWQSKRSVLYKRERESLDK